MKMAPLPTKKQALFTCSVVLLLGLSVLGDWFWPASPQQLFERNQRRWVERSFSTYRMSLQIERLGVVCTQEFDAQGEDVVRVIKDTCDTPWLASMTVGRLFDVHERIVRSAAAHCYPSDLFCTCRRMLTRQIVYDSELGYPQLMIYERSTGFNWPNLDFWKYLVERRALPNCTTPHRNLIIAVTSLSPAR